MISLSSVERLKLVLPFSIIDLGNIIFVMFQHFVTSYFSQPAGVPVNVTLSIVREQGSSGEVAIHYQTRPALYQPPSNQATAGRDYTAKDDTIVMIDGATVALVTVTVLPVSLDCCVIELIKST